jgi:hypothetical protein
MSTEEISILINKIKAALTEYESGDLFGGKQYLQALKEACANFLKFFRYRVYPPMIVRNDYTKLDQLRTLFYSLARYHYGDKFIVGSRGEAADRAALKMFVNSRIAASNITRQEAYNECAFIMQKAFEYKDDIGLDHQLTLYTFVPGKMSWFVEAVIEKANEHIEECYMEDMDRKIDSLDIDWGMIK